MSCISLTLQMSMNNSLPLSEDVDRTSETVDVELGDSFRVSKASLETRFDGATGALLTSGGLWGVLLLGVSLLERRGRAKAEPPKLETDSEFSPPPKTGCFSFGVVRGREYLGLLVLPKVELALGRLGENPWPKHNVLDVIAAAADSVVQTNSLWREE